MPINFERALKGTKGQIFYLLLREPGLNVTQLAEKIGIKQPSMTLALQILEKNKMVKIEFDDKGTGIKKRYTPSYRGFFEQQAKSFEIDIPDEVYDSIDEVLLDPKIKPLWLKVSEKASEVKNAMSIIMASSVMILDPDFQIKIQDILKKDRKLQLAWNNGIIKYAEILRKKFQF